MKIKYNELKQTIEIDDEMKNHFFINKLLLIINLIVVLLNLYNINETGIGFMQGVWLLFGVMFIVFFYLQFYRKSTSNIIPIKNIKGLKEKLFFGGKWFSLELLNGKMRDLGKLKTQTEITEIKKLFSEIGVLN